jgi:hypothetical protein
MLIRHLATVIVVLCIGLAVWFIGTTVLLGSHGGLHCSSAPAQTTAANQPATPQSSSQSAPTAASAMSALTRAACTPHPRFRVLSGGRSGHS